MKARVLPLMLAFLLGLAGALALTACAELTPTTLTPGTESTATSTPAVGSSPTVTPLPPLTYAPGQDTPTSTPSPTSPAATTAPSDTPTPAATASPATTASPAPVESPTGTVIPGTLLTYEIVDPPEASEGDLLTYAVIVLNDIMIGPDPGTRVIVVDVLPVQAIYVAGTASTGATYVPEQNAIIWQGSVPRGSNAIISFQVRVGGAEVGSRIDNEALITDAFGRVATAQASTLVVPGRGLPTPTPTATQPALTLIPQTPTPTASATPTITPTPTNTPLPTPPIIYNWKGEYFDNRNLGGTPVLVRDDAVISFDWGTGSPAPQVPVDNFSARWTRSLNFEGLTYNFYVTVDDGCRLWIDGQLVIDAWVDGSERTVSGTMAMLRGVHQIRLEYYEHTGEALVRLWWEPVLVYPDWKGEYFANRDLAGPVDVTRDDVTIDFDWGTLAPIVGLPADNFSVRWTRTAYFDASDYRFTVTVDDGMRLWVDGVLVIDEWHDGASRTVTADYPMVAGVHSLRVEYYEHLDIALIHVRWDKVLNYPDWRGEYWANPSLSGAPSLVRNDTEINFDWGSGAVAPNMPSDNFSARWTRTLSFDPGTYRFHAIADDVVRVYVDNNLIINSWGAYNPNEMTADVLLSAGQHTLRVEYAEYLGVAKIHVWWERVDTYPDWKGQYWSNPDLAGTPMLTRNDTDINFNWGYGAPAPGLPLDNYSVRWTRTLNFDAGTYDFHVQANGSIRLWVDDVLLLGTWGSPTSNELVATQSLIAGAHDIRLEYADRGGEGRVHLFWEEQQDFPDWKGEYWSNPDLSGPPALVRNDAEINFNWGTGSPAPGLPADNFSARWTRTLFFEADTYRFHARADDLVRVWVDDTLIINQWDTFTPNEIIADYAITRGQHQIRVEYVERSGGASISVSWEPITAFPDWKGEYYPNPDLSGPPFLVRDDPQINFDWGQGAVVNGMPKDDFSVRWTRMLVLTPGTYRFYARADDGIRIYVDGDLVLDEWHAGTNQEYTVDVTFADRHEMTVEYYDHVFEASVSVSWQRIQGGPQPGAH